MHKRIIPIGNTMMENVIRNANMKYTYLYISISVITILPFSNIVNKSYCFLISYNHLYIFLHNASSLGVMKLWSDFEIYRIKHISY